MLVFILGILSFIGLFFFHNLGFYPHVPSILDLFSGPIVALPFVLFWLVSSGKLMGLGDAKLALSLGWLLGISRAFSGIIISVWIGAAVGVILVIFSKKHKMTSEIPFAPFLVLGAILVFFGLSLF
jgi:leader peptidase (prepilin peptidase)/N-methyltransferase